MSFPPPPPPMFAQHQGPPYDMYGQGGYGGMYAPHQSGPPPLMSLSVNMPPGSEYAQQDYREEEDEDYDDDQSGIPKAIEKVLRSKELRAQQLGLKDVDDIQTLIQLEVENGTNDHQELDDNADDENDDDTISGQNQSNATSDRKKQKRKEKKKRAKQRKRAQGKTSDADAVQENKQDDSGVDENDDELDVDIEYVQEGIPVDLSDPNYFYFSKIFQAFKIGEGADDLDIKKEPEPAKPVFPKEPKDKLFEDEDEPGAQDSKKVTDGQQKLSKRKLKLMLRPSIADLKASCNRPDVVEWHDVTARDPKLLVHLKACRNTVPVPRHWCFKRKYLAGKRGFEKPPFELPEFIRKTGIMEMRQALADKEDQKTSKAKMREKVRPKLGKIDIDYQKLHDAFFRWQTKPKMSLMGDLYYEGKELETRMRDKKPGDLSDDLRTALGMPLGPNAGKFPPPWLIAMQRYGPPPSYPNLKIPGLNAPIPEGCSFGYHAGGWGKPPVDETGRPLYGDVFGLDMHIRMMGELDGAIDKGLWGELESESEEESEESEEEMEEEMADESGIVTPAEGLITPSGMSSSVTAGVETPDTIELRKKKIQQELEGGETPTLFTVLPEKKVDRIGQQMMASTHVYDLAAAMPGKTKETSAAAASRSDAVEVALNPDELDLADTAAMSAKYEEKLKEQQLGKDEDLSDMVAEHAARQKRKRRVQEEKKSTSSSTSSAKKYKDFKF